MQKIINYQMSVFGDFKFYEPTLERMNSLAKTPAELNLKLLPSMATIIPLDNMVPQSGKINTPTVLQRIQMVDTDRKLSLVIMPERIDVNLAQTNSEEAEPLDIISEKALAVLKHAISIIEAKYWRIAINLESHKEDGSYDGANISALYNALALPLAHQVDREIIEWQIMSNCPQDVLFERGQSEKVNVITVLSRLQNLETNMPCVLAQLDVNTSATNRAYRFNDEEVEVFYSSAIEIIKNIIGDIEKKWQND
jgi:hypothetical protein